MIRSGRSLELFFIDGRADGMLTAEVFNWTGHVLRAPRTQIKQALMRPEAGFTGVYVLIGEDENGPRAYIGEAEDMRLRLRDHVTNKSWWDDAILISSAANNLHKAHIKYLESRLVEIARDVAHTPLENGNTPPRSSLNEAARANMESFIDTLMMVFPAIRVDLFLSKKRSVLADLNPKKVDDVAKFEFKVQRHSVHALAIVRGGEVIVQAGSTARATWVGDRTNKTSYSKLHDELVANGTISVNGEAATFVQDYAFSSPSSAAAVVSGRSANGRTSWVHVTTQKTYADWEAEQLADVTS
jgi:hypothetical protein